jgi:hypothetical protein
MWAASKPERALSLLQVVQARKWCFFLRIRQIFQQARHFIVVPERDPDRSFSSTRQVTVF